MIDPPFCIEPATAEQVPELVRFACAMARETEDKALDAERVERGIRTLMTQPTRGRYRVARRGDSLLGALMLTVEWSDWRCADWWWIQSVYVRPEARRTGVFRALYQDVLDEARSQSDVCGLRLYVEHDNRVAQQTYAALGMRDAGYRMLEHALPSADRA